MLFVSLEPIGLVSVPIVLGGVELMGPLVPIDPLEPAVCAMPGVASASEAAQTSAIFIT